MVIGDAANINWLTGYDAWSFYTPQMMLVDLHDGPFWMGRLMDAGAAEFTSYLTDDQIVAYPETLVQRPDIHPMSYLADWMADHGFATARIGYESDSYYFSPRALTALQAGLPDADFIDADLLVNWQRLVKSPAEIAVMQKAARIAEAAMQTAWNGVQVGVRQCDLMADVTATQIRGVDGLGGDMTAIHPLILAGEAAATAHPMWTEAPLEDGQTIAFELGACYRRYNVGLARTVHLGSPDDEVKRTSEAVQDGMAAVMAALKPGSIAGDVHAAWQGFLTGMVWRNQAVLATPSVRHMPRLGRAYSVDPTHETTVIPENAVIHVILGMWMSDWGMELSETLHVCEDGCTRMCDFPQHVHIIET